MSVAVRTREIPSFQVLRGTALDPTFSDPLEQAAAETEERRFGSPGRLELRTDHSLALVKQRLGESGALLAEISEHTRKLAEHLRLGQSAEFSHLFVTTVDDLLSFLKLLEVVQAFLGHSPKKSIVEQFQHNLKEQVNHLFRAQQQQDPTLLADLLEFEMAPLFEGWPGVRAVLLKHVEQRPA